MSTNLSSGTPNTGATMPNNSGITAGETEGVYNSATAAKRQSGANLREELANLKSDLDALLARAADLTDAELSEAQDKILAKFASMRHAAKGMAAEASRQFNHGVDVTSEYVKEKPLQSVAVATGVGLLLGMVLRRR